MKYALVEGNKTEAIRGAKGICRCCGTELVAKCGEVRVNHWAHKGNRMCDPWWENETEWHRQWKDEFPVSWQEVIHFDRKGEKHIADVKTSEDWVLEFQHSYLKPEERRAREAFYGNLIWIVDGQRRTRDKEQFRRLLNGSIHLYEKPHIFRIYYPEDCRIVKEWLDSRATVFLDFGQSDQAGPTLWLLGSQGLNRGYYLMYSSVPAFTKLLNDGEFGKNFTDYMQAVRALLDGKPWPFRTK